jgi:hypothetical protein
MRKTLLLAAGLVLALAWAKPAAADAVIFDPDGAGGSGTVTGVIFDWAPGNSLLQENEAAGTGVILFQANLASILSQGGVPVFSNGTGNNFFTVVAVIDVTLQAGNAFTTVGGTFKIYHDSDPGNNLTGLGFAADPGALEVLSGHFVSGTGGFALNTGTNVILDQYPTATPADNDYPTTHTLTSTSGSANSTGIVDTFNSAYFTNLIAGVTMTITSTKILLPYTQVDPSAQFSQNAITDGGVAGAGSISLCGPVPAGQANTVLNPCINGTGSNIIAETDSSTSFQGVTSVPEPATMTLLGLGLLGSAAARRRQLKAKKAV